MLYETGGVVDDLIVYFVGDGQYRMVINAGTAEKDLAWMAARLADWKLDVAVVARRSRRGGRGAIIPVGDAV